MAALISYIKSQKGKDLIVDSSNYRYTLKEASKEMKNWRCQHLRSCPVRLKTQVSSGNLVGDQLPLHDH